jgi:hypothetical protein
MVLMKLAEAKMPSGIKLSEAAQAKRCSCLTPRRWRLDSAPLGRKIVSPTIQETWVYSLGIPESRVQPGSLTLTLNLMGRTPLRQDKTRRSN